MNVEEKEREKIRKTDGWIVNDLSDAGVCGRDMEDRHKRRSEDKDG